MHINTHAFSLGCFPAFFLTFFFSFYLLFQFLSLFAIWGSARQQTTRRCSFFVVGLDFFIISAAALLLDSFCFVFSRYQSAVYCVFSLLFLWMLFFFFHFSSPCYTGFVFVSLSLPLLFFQGVFFFSHLRLIQPPLFCSPCCCFPLSVVVPQSSTLYVVLSRMERKAAQ